MTDKPNIVVLHKRQLQASGVQAAIPETAPA